MKRKGLLTAALWLALCMPCAASAQEDAAVHAGTQALEGAAWIDLDGGAGALPDGVSRQGGVVTVASAGTYRVTGTLEGQLAVVVGKRDEVTLAFDGVDLKNGQDSALFVGNAGRVTILLCEGSENRVVSGEQAALDGSAVDESAEGGAIYARDDLTIEGKGALFVGGYLNNGVHTSNRLTVSGGELTVEAVNNGLKGKDAVLLAGGSVRVVCGGDGVTSNDETGEGFGVVTVTGGSLDVTSAKDGVQAETLIEISGGEVAVVSSGGSANAPAHQDDFGGMRGFGGRGGLDGGGRHGADGLRGADAPSGGEPLPDAREPEPPSDAPDAREPEPPQDAPDARDPIKEMEPPAVSEQEEPDGAKGIKAGSALRISGGKIAVDAADDALHSDGSLEVTGGSLTLSSGDDGLHADERLTIDGGSVSVRAAYEGIEANQIAIGGGEISVTATDDGLNANGGTQVSWGRRAAPEAQEAQEAQEDGAMPNLMVTGGSLCVNAQGDGLDSNGNILISGGLVVVDGPSGSGNGALDSGAEGGGACEVHGGTVLAVGAAGMAEAFDAGSTQVSFQANFGATVPAGSALTVTDEAGETLFSHTAAKPFSSVVFSCPALTLGEAVTVTADGQSVQVTLEDVANPAEEARFWRRW